MLKAELPKATNRQTAKELGDVMNTLYQSPLQETFQRDGKYSGGIVYKENGQYEFLD